MYIRLPLICLISEVQMSLAVILEAVSLSANDSIKCLALSTYICVLFA